MPSVREAVPVNQSGSEGAEMNKIQKLYYLNLLNEIVPGWEMEYKFHPKRQWRADYCNQELQILVEIEGGVFIGGGHVRGAMYIKNCEKYNAASMLGWVVLRYALDKREVARMNNELREYLKLPLDNRKNRPILSSVKETE